MILRALYDLAQRERLVSDPDFQMVGVSWVVRVSREGRIILPIGDVRHEEPTTGRRAPRLVPKQMRVPRQAGRSGTKAPPNFLVDNAKYVFGLATADKPFSLEEGRAKSRWFRDAVAACAEATGDEGARAVVAALDAVASGEQRIILPEECKSNEQFAFIYESDIDTPVHARPLVEAYWKRLRAGYESDGDAGRASARCVITGDPVTTPSLFPKVKKVPGGQSAGASLVSFNASAFESYGLASSENAPISRAAAEAASTALQRLVDPAFPSPDPLRLGETLPRRQLPISNDTLVCYWASEAAADPFLDVLGSILDASDPEEVGEMYRAIWRGRPAPVGDVGAFYALTISGAQGRLVVRDWFEDTVSRVSEHLAQFFTDLEVVRNTPAVKGREPSAHLPLPVLLSALAPFGKRDEIPSALAGAIVRAALQGAPTPYPIAVLQRALERARAESGRDDWADLERRDARAALIKAVLRRTFNHEVTVAMDSTNTNAGYLCGRLMAVLERLQQVALGDVNASIVDRYFGAASATPRAVFVRLLRNAQHHARKAQDDPKTAGFAIQLKRTIDEIAARFDPKENGFPAFLPLDEQGLFVLGYHQLRHALWTKRADASDASDAAESSAA